MLLEKSPIFLQRVQEVETQTFKGQIWIDYTVQGLMSFPKNKSSSSSFDAHDACTH